MFFFFFKQKTAYEMRISDWSSDVCSSDLERLRASKAPEPPAMIAAASMQDVISSSKRRPTRRIPDTARMRSRTLTGASPGRDAAEPGHRQHANQRPAHPPPPSSEERRVGQKSVRT